MGLGFTVWFPTFQVVVLRSYARSFERLTYVRDIVRELATCLSWGDKSASCGMNCI